jgi:hypothetical protein
MNSPSASAAEVIQAGCCHRNGFDGEADALMFLESGSVHRHEYPVFESCFHGQGHCRFSRIEGVFTQVSDFQWVAAVASRRFPYWNLPGFVAFSKVRDRFDPYQDRGCASLEAEASEVHHVQRVRPAACRDAPDHAWLMCRCRWLFQVPPAVFPFYFCLSRRRTRSVSFTRSPRYQCLSGIDKSNRRMPATALDHASRHAEHK